MRKHRKISMNFTVSNICQRFVFWYLQPDHYRSSSQSCFIKKVLSKNFAIFTGKHLCWRLFFLESTLFKRVSNTSVFVWILWKFLRTLIFKKICQRLLLSLPKICSKYGVFLFFSVCPDWIWRSTVNFS